VGAAAALLGACAEAGDEQANWNQAVMSAPDARLPQPSLDAGGGTGGGYLAPITDAAPGQLDGAPLPVVDAGIPSLPGPDTGYDAATSDSGPTAADAGGDGVSAALMGPYKTKSYDGPFDPVIDSSAIYYPLDAPGPFPIVALSPGFTNVKEDFLWWGDVMASHGFAIAVLSPTSALDFPPDRADDLEAGVALLLAENTRSGSPLMGKVDATRTGLMGHSMGGGAVLIVLARSGVRYQAGVAMEPWEDPNFTTVASPTLILAGEVDLVASPNDMAWPFYQQIPSGVPKAYAEFAGFGHNTPNNLGSEHEHELHAQWTIAWFKLQLAKDTRYETFIKNSPDLSRFARAPQ
jgi:hypothetical protein